MLTAMAQKLAFCVVGVEQLASCEALENPFLSENFHPYGRACIKCIILHACLPPFFDDRRQSWRGSDYLLQLH
ncbi:hypothetical protein ACXP0D_06080 [Klebsiella pneumoniae]|uniref:hypothetical protein n=1 Tax=Klebsiella pneumoniae TaxID=573 RepID=UPI001C8CC71F|nr:hypothetical protein [Klebsiella pneumoniae]